MRRQDLPGLALFAAVAEAGSFRGAARSLGVSVSAVSHAITALEQRMAARLLVRTTRSLSLTPAGQRLLDGLAPALAAIDEAVESAGALQNSLAGTLRFTVPRSAAQLFMVPLALRFMQREPGVTVEVIVQDGFTDIVAEGFDGGVRFGESLEQDMIAVPLGGRQRAAVICAPQVLDGREPPRHPRDLAGFVCLQRRFAGGGLYRWEFARDEEVLEVAVTGGLVLNDDALILEAALAGGGMALAFEAQAAPALAQGRLVRVLEDWCPAFAGFHLYYPDRRLMRPALRAFLDFVHQESRGRADARPGAAGAREG